MAGNDIATLGIKIDTSDIVKTEKSLNKLAETTAKVESATSKIAATMGAYVNSTRSASSEELKRQKAIDKMIEGLKQQDIRYSSGKTALVDYKLSLLNATEAEKKQAKALSEKIQLMQDANKKSIDASDIMGKLATRVSALAAAYFGISAIKNFANEILETAKIADNFKYSLLAVSDSSEQAAETYKYLEKEANRLGQSITGNVDAFTGFMAAAKAANMTTEQAKKAYTGLNEAMTALHRTPAQASQALYALQQMLSTGTVRAQELNIQLGNAIPGAVPMFAQALGKTTAELRKMMEQGLVPANESVIKFTDYLSNKFAPSAEAAADSVQGNLNKMSNAAYNLKKAIVDAMGDNTTGIIKDATNALIDFTNALKTEEGKQFIADLSTTIKEAASGALRLASALGSVLQYANLRSLSGTMEQAAELSKKGMLDIQKFATSSALERQRMVDDVLKKESELQKSQQETIKNQKELLQAISDTSIETKNAGDAFNRGWSPIVGTTAEITDKMRENEKTIKSITEKLQEQAITAGKTGVEKVRAELEAANATDEEKKSILALAAANEQKENARKNAEKAQRKAEQDAEAAIRKAEAAEKARQGRIDSIIQKLKDQIATYKQGKEVSAEVALQHENATPQIIEYAKALGRELDQMKAINKAQKEYDALMAKTAPDQVDLKRNEAIAILNEQFKDVTKNADEYKKSLKQINDYYDTKELKEYETEVSKLAETIGSLKTSSFGNEMADGINNAVISMRDLNDYLEKNKDTYDDIKKKREEAYAIANEDEREKKIKELDELEGKYTASQLTGYRQLFGTISQLYGENTKEREALHKIEMAFAAAEIAMNLQKTISAAYTAIATQGAGDPYTAFARVAAMTALMAGIVSAAGGSLSGGGSGGGASAAASTSSSTVLGGTEGSQSISNSLDFMTDIQSKQYNELRDINTGVESLNKNITGLVTSIVRTGGVSSVSGAVAGTSGGTSTVQESLVRYSTLTGISTSIFSDLFKNIPILGNVMGGFSDWVEDITNNIAGAIFGGSKKTSILAQGLEVSTGKISDLLGGMGADIQKFADIKIKKEGGLFGSDKTYYKTLYESLGDENVSKMFTNVFKNMGETMVAISKELNLGEDNLKQILEYSFDIGKLDLKGLDADAINKAVSEAISTSGDVAIQALFGELIGKYQEVGEGLLETAIRVVSEKGVVEDILSMTNQAFDNAAIPEIALATTQSIIDLAGGIKQLQESSSTYFNEFFTDAEKQSRLYSQLSGAMASINLPMAENRDAFRAMVESLDLNTEAGREQYATLLNLSEAADKYYDTLEGGEKTTKDNSDAIVSMVTDTKKAIEQMDMSEFDKSIQNINDNTEKSIKQLTDMGASESDLAVIREYGNKQIQELTDAQNQQIADEKAASESLRASKQLELDILNGVATEQDKVNFQRQQELKTLPESVQAIQQAIWAKEDEIAANEKAAKIASEKSALELRIDELTMSSADFLAKKRQLELAAMDESLKPLQERIYQLEDEATANAKAAEIADKRQSLEIEILNLTGKSAEAVALQRKIELASLDDSLKPLQERVWALQDEQSAITETTQASTKKFELEIELLNLTGKAAQATAMQREKELSEMTSGEQELQKRVWALQDESAAIQKAADIANERKNLEVQLLELEGKSKEAVALQRQLELASIDDSNKALKERIWLLQDEKDAADAAKAIADQLAEQQKQYQEKVLSERISLENELLQLQGNTAELRRRELESIDKSNRSLQLRIWQLQDEAELQSMIETETQKVESLKESLTKKLLELQGDTEEIRKLEIESITNLNSELRQKLKDLRDDLAEAEFSIPQLEEAIASDTQDILDISQEMARLINDNADMSDRIRQLRRDGVSEEEEIIIDELNLKIYRNNEERKLLQSKKDSISAFIENLKADLDKYKDILRDTPLEIEKITEALGDISVDEVTDLQEEIWELEDALEAAAKAAAVAEEKQALELEIMKLTGRSSEALALTRQQELLKLDESNRSLQERIWDLQDEAETAEKASALSNKRKSLEIKILEATGHAAEALAMQRAIELESLEESLRPLQERLWQLEDEAALTEKAKAISEEKANLELRLAELTMSNYEYIALTRQKELLSLDESNRSLQERIWQLEDEAAVIEKNKAIAEEKAGLELRIAELTLSSSEYLALTRQKELDKLDESNRTLRERIYLLEDEALVAERNKEIQQEKADLEMRLAELTLSESEYLALTRQKELLAIDESNRNLQKKIWLIEDEKKTEEEAQKAIEDRINTLEAEYDKAESVLKESIQDQIDEYQKLADIANEAFENATDALSRSFEYAQSQIENRFKILIDSLASDLDNANKIAETLQSNFDSLSSARKSMEGSGATISYAQAQKQLGMTLAAARTGNLSLVENMIPNLDILTNRGMEEYASQSDYKRDFYKTYGSLSELEGIVGKQLTEQQLIIKSLEDQITLAEKQQTELLDKLQAQYDAVIGVDNTIIDFETAVKKYQLAQNEADGANTLLKIQTEQLNNQLTALTEINDTLLDVETAINRFLEIQRQLQAEKNKTEVSPVIPGYANGGIHEGGLRIVGERGAELEYTPPARITSNNDLKSMMSDEDVKRILSEIKEEISRGNFVIAKNTQDSAKTLKKFDYDGMPTTRTE